MKWQALLRRPANVVAIAVFVIVGVFWAATAIQSARAETLDQRTHDVASQLQCPACNGESVADSSAPIAQDMRGIIRQKLAAGASDQDVLDYFEQHYTASILESPPKTGFTLLIWLAPVVMFLASLLLLGSVGREWRAARLGAGTPAVDDAPVPALSASERERYRRLLQRELDSEEGFSGPGALGLEGE
jgi:cytochrome c-type biogenesis protein CcmH